ncbi:MAG: hypothetical protein R6T89_05520 [Candidatus Syntrophosphaera sp.]
MPPKDGEKTGQFGLWLTGYVCSKLLDKNYTVYYDHGDPTEHSNVAAIKGFLGEKVKNENRLADVDVMVADEDRGIKMLIEIEESPISPKTLLADVFASLLSTKFAVKIGNENIYFSKTPGTCLIVAGYNPNDKRRRFINNKVLKKLRGFLPPENAINPEQVEFIIESDLGHCLERLRQRVREIL